MKYHLTAMKSAQTAMKLNSDVKSFRPAKKDAAAKLLCNSDEKRGFAAMRNWQQRWRIKRRKMQKSDETCFTAMRLLSLVDLTLKQFLGGSFGQLSRRAPDSCLKIARKNPILHRELGGAGLSDRDLLLLLVFTHSNVVPVHLWPFLFLGIVVVFLAHYGRVSTLSQGKSLSRHHVFSRF